ncbi:MAG: thioredoxin family protein [Candidatus Limimorpha sp.]
MRKAIIILAIFTSLPFILDAQKINWLTFEEAVKLNETAPRKIFIDVFTDWCGWCKRMDNTTFTDASVAKYINENYYAVKLDAEMNDTIIFSGHTFINEGGTNGRKGTHQLAAALLQGRLSYPSYVFMNEKNQLLTIVPGYMEPKDIMPILEYFGTDAYLNQDWQEYNKK